MAPVLDPTEIGINRVLYGSDAATSDNLPKDALEQWHRLSLTQDEFRAIENNVAPYLTDWLKRIRVN